MQVRRNTQLRLPIVDVIFRPALPTILSIPFLSLPQTSPQLPRSSCLLISGCQHVLNRKLVLSLFGSFSLAMQHLCSGYSVLKTYSLEMVTWQKEMENASRATGRTGLGKLATDDASPPWSPFFQ